MAAAGWLAAAACGAAAPAFAQSSVTAACAAAEYHALDFWVGEWIVTRPDTGAQVARSRIDNLHGGCVIREQWMPLAGAGGSSLSHYDSTRRSWRQLWLDGNGSRVDFEGGLVGADMVLTGLWPNLNGPGQDAIVRMTYSLRPDGKVMQRGEASTDQGRSWSLSFLFIYERAPGAPVGTAQGE